MKLANTQDLKSCAARLEGSTPFFVTMAECKHDKMFEVSNLAVCLDCGQEYIIHTNIEFDWHPDDFKRNFFRVSLVKTYRPVMKQPDGTKAVYYGRNEN